MRTNWIKLWCRTDIKEKVKIPPTDHLHHETHRSDLRKRQKGCQKLMSFVALVNSPGPSINAIWQFWHQNLQNDRIYIVPKWFILFIMSLEGLFFLSCTTTFHLGQMAFAHKASVNCHAVIYPALTFTIADTLLQMKPRVLQSFRISSGRIVAPYSWGGLPSRLRVNQSFSA